MKKQPKKKNPFKVDHVRSIKLKAKAKQYTGNLKQLKAIVTDKVKSSNDQLSSLEEVVRQAPKKETLPVKLESPRNPESTGTTRKELEENFLRSQESEADALEKLTSWKFND